MKLGRLLIPSLLVVVVACGGETQSEVPETLSILSHDSFADGVTDETFAAFTEETGIAVEVVPAGDAGGAVNQAILTKDNPLADVLFGVDDTFLSRALNEDIFVAHESEFLSDVDDSLEVDPEHRVTPIDFGDVCLNYDIAWFTENGIEPPATLDDLAEPAYADLLVVEDPAASSPGLAFLLATIDRYGDGWQDYWQSLVDNGVDVASDWDTAYYNDFSYHGGENPLVVSYASSPPAEVMFAETPIDEAPTGVITDGCYRQIEFAGILANTDYPEAAGRLIDFMLSPDFQAGIPESWFVFPANSTVELPQVFAENTVVPEDPASLEAEQIDANREDWLDGWRQVVAP